MAAGLAIAPSVSGGGAARRHWTQGVGHRSVLACRGDRPSLLGPQILSGTPAKGAVYSTHTFPLNLSEFGDS